MIKIDIKPLSVNLAWQGRRFKTPKYKQYERDVLFLLPKIKLPDPPYQIHYEFGFSNSLSDFDNPVKLITDILQKKYKFNDKLIKRAIIDIEQTEKGKEYFKFEITTKYLVSKKEVVNKLKCKYFISACKDENFCCETCQYY